MGDPSLGHSPVEVLDRHRSEPVPQRLQVHRRRRTAENTATSLRVDLPGRTGGRAPARHLEPALRTEHHLHGPPVLFRDHQRTLDLRVGEHGSRIAPRHRERLPYLRQEERPRRHHFTEHPVVPEPTRILPGQLALEGNPPVPRVPPGPQQRMSRRGPAALRSPHPVPLALEGIGGKGQPAPALAREETRERDRQPGLVGVSHRLDEARLPAEAPDHPRGVVPAGPGARRQRSEHRPRANLDEDAGAEVVQRTDAGGEGHRGSRLQSPVGAVERLVGTNDAPGHVAHQRDRGGGEREVAGGAGQLGKHRIEQRAVEGVARAQPFAAQLLPDAARLQGGDEAGRPTHHLVDAVFGRHVEPHPRDAGVRLLHERPHPVFRRRDGGHRPAFRLRGREGAAPDGEPHAVLESEHPGGPGRREFAHAVPQHRVRPDPHLGPEGGEGAGEREERRLGERGVIEVARRSGGAEHHREQRFPPLGPEHRVAAVQHLPRRRFAVVEIASHPDPLASLAGEQEGHLPARLPAHSPGFDAAGDGRRPEPVPETRAVPEEDGRPPPEVGASGPRHPGEVRTPRGREIPATRFEPGEVAPREFRNPLAAPGGQREQPDLARRRIPGFRIPGLRPGGGGALGVPESVRGRIEDQVHVRSRQAERTHRRPRPAVEGLRPRRRPGRHPHRQPFPIHLRVRPLEVEVLRDRAGAQREKYLDHPGDARGRLEVPDVGLDGPDQ